MNKNAKQLEELSSEFVHFVLEQLSGDDIDIKDESLVRDLAGYTAGLHGFNQKTILNS